MESESKGFLKKWIHFFTTRYRTTWVLLVAILIAGVWGLANNQRQDFPTIPANFISVTATYPGASSGDVEQQVVIPLEQVALAQDGVKNVRASAQRNFGSVFIEMEDIDGIEDKTDELEKDINKVNLPSDVEVNVNTVDVTGPLIALGIVGSNGESTADLLGYASDIKTNLENSSTEIKEIEIQPENEFNVVVELNAEALNDNFLTYELVQSALSSQITAIPGGSVKNDEGRIEAINIQAPASTLEDIENTSLGSVQLKDVANVKRVPKNEDEAHFGGYVKDGEAQWKESVYMLVYKKDDGDAIRISDAVAGAIDEIKESGTIPEDIDVVTLYDSSPYVKNQIESLVNNGLLGLFLILVVLLFFINLRTAVLVATIIPLAFLITLFVLPVVGFTINILTLFAMILTLGILVDNAIVIAEGIVHEIEKGAKKAKASIIAIEKLGTAVTAATFTTIVVFIPFATIGGIIGEFMKFIPYTIIIMLVTSYFLAITVTPFLAKYILKEEKTVDRLNRELPTWQKVILIPYIVQKGQAFIEHFADSYEKGMNRIFEKRWKRISMVGITVVLFLTSFGYFAGQLEFKQFPETDSNLMTVTVDFPVGTPAEEKKDVLALVQDEIITLPYFETFYTFDGTLFITFVQPTEREDDTTLFEINDTLDTDLEDVRAQINPEIDIKPSVQSEGPPESEFDVTVELLGDDETALRTAADDLETFALDQDGVQDVVNGPRDLEVTSVEVNFDRDKLADNNASALLAAGTVNSVFTRQEVGSITLRNDRVSDSVFLGFDASSTNSVDDIRDLSVPTLTNRAVALRDVASVDEVTNLSSISRLDGRRTAQVAIDLEDEIDPIAFEQTIRDYLTEDKLVELGLEKDGVSYGGFSVQSAEDYANLQIVFILAIIFVYLILIYQFNSFSQPLLILLTIPIAMIGVFPGLFLVDSSLDMISGLGVIALVGIVVNDAIVFISTYNRYKGEHPELNKYELLARTGRSRFKPILSTSITTIFGILPLTIRDPFWTGLGTSVIAGLIFSTIGTLVIIPIIYSMMMRKKKAKKA